MTETQQYGDLVRLYGDYGDEELKNLALTFNDLTEPAQRALKAEFARRNLPLPAPSVPQVQNDDDALQRFAADATEDSTFEFTDLEEAYIAQSVLRSAGIQSVVPTSEIGAVDTPRLIVAPADAHTAELLLSRATDSASDAEAAGFVEPVCPKCGTPDPLLESVEPTNQWRCEACNHLWHDSEAA